MRLVLLILTNSKIVTVPPLAPQKRSDQSNSPALIPNLSASIPKLTTEKAKAFEIFKKDYPGASWIEEQKSLLRSKYAEAKSLGEEANKLRLGISK